MPAYYTGDIPGYPRTNGGSRMEYAYTNRGNWAKVSYSNGKVSSSIITKSYFDSFGKFRYTK